MHSGAPRRYTTHDGGEGADIPREAEKQFEHFPVPDPADPAGATELADWKAAMAVTLSGEALALPDIRLDKIAIVQSALANGSYQVRTSELASKVIDSMVDSMAGSLHPKSASMAAAPNLDTRFNSSAGDEHKPLE